MIRTRIVLPLLLLATPTALAEPRPAAIDDLFALYLVSSGSVADGEIRSHVRVFNPYGLRPLPGVVVTATLEGHADRAATVATGERGEAELVLALPDDLGDGTLVVRARARFRGVEREVENWLFLDARGAVADGSAGVLLAGRASRWPIHADLVGWLPRPGLPSHAFVTTLTADGEPVACDVRIRWRSGDGEEREIARLATDRHGLGRVELAEEAEDGELTILAHDAAGRSGEAVIDYQVLWDDALVVHTPRTVHRRGEPLVVTVHPLAPMDDVVVEVRRGDRRLRERRLDRLESAARLVFDGGDDLAGRVDVVAYSLSPAYAEVELPAGRRTVLYPRGQELDPSGEDGEEHAGWTVARFLDLALDGDVPADLDRIAELLVRRDGARVTKGLSTPLGEEPWVYQWYFGPQLRGWKAKLEQAYGPPRYALPKDMASLAAILGRPGLDRLSDPWGTPYRGAFGLEGDLWTFELESAGRDRLWGSIDDFVVWSHSWVVRPGSLQGEKKPGGLG